MLVTAIKGKGVATTDNMETLAPVSSEIETELEEVKILFEKGLINEEDYNFAKQTILKKYYD